MTTFTQTHHAQNPVNIELLNFVNQRGHASWADLFAAFGDGSASEKGSTQRFGKKLEYLLYTGRLICTGRGTARVFYIGPEATQPVPARGLTTARAGQVQGSDAAPTYQHLQYLGAVVPPRQFNTMDSDPYVPPTQVAMRPGALDYQRYASHGDHC